MWTMSCLMLARSYWRHENILLLLYNDKKETFLGEILALAGCDLLTISPGLLEKLDNMQEPVNKALSTETAQVYKRLVLLFISRCAPSI